MLQNTLIGTNVHAIIQAITPDGYLQLVHEVSDRGYLTVTYCYSIINKFTNLHPDWVFVYAGCIY